jgi:hypothetical protein
MKKWLVAIACLTTLGSSIALAQDSMRNAPPSAVKRAQQPQQPATTVTAPVGHRQPRAGDVPQETGSNDPGKIDAQDRELDRLIKGICKGC